MGLPAVIVFVAWLVAVPLIGLRLLLLKIPVLKDLVNWMYRPRISEDERRDGKSYRAAMIESSRKLDSLIDAATPIEHDYFETEPGVFLHYVACGKKDAPPMIFLHGFPEFYFTWSHLLKEFSKTHRCYAIDQRGYNISSKPETLADYAGEKLVGDIERFASSVLGKSGKCVLVAHDWGAAVAFQIAHCCNFVRELVILDMPHPVLFQKALLSSTSQKRRSMYILYFQLPYLPEALFSDPSKRTVAKLMPSLSPAHADAFCRAAEQPGAMTGALNWYRAAFGMRTARWVRKQIDVPVLQMMGAATTPFDLKAVNVGLEKYVSNLKQVTIANASHWVQHDQPAEVIKQMRVFLK